MKPIVKLQTWEGGVVSIPLYKHDRDAGELEGAAWVSTDHHLSGPKV